MNYPLWQRDDKYYEHKTLLEQDFTLTDQMNKYMWEFANFEGGKSIIELLTAVLRMEIDGLKVQHVEIGVYLF